MILKRIVIFRLLCYGTMILTMGSFLSSSQASDSEASITPSFFYDHATEQGQRFKLSGVIKNGSIAMKKGTLENKFLVTDFKNDIEVVFRGALPSTFKEGDMA